jgi:hypothetical protein
MIESGEKWKKSWQMSKRMGFELLTMRYICYVPPGFVSSFTRQRRCGTWSQDMGCVGE